MELNSNHRAVAHATERGQGARPALQCVAIGDGHITAGDGYILVQRKLDTSELGERKLFIQGLELDGMAKGRGLLSLTLMEDSSVKLSVDNTHRIAKQEKGIWAFSCSWPSSPPIASFALSIPLLKKLLQSLGDEKVLRFRVRAGETAPIEFSAGETNGLIMPYFARDEDGYWHEPATPG